MQAYLGQIRSAAGTGNGVALGTLLAARPGNNFSSVAAMCRGVRYTASVDANGRRFYLRAFDFGRLRADKH